MRDVLNRMCGVCGMKQPTFGREDRKATHCRDCKEAGMRDVRSKTCSVCVTKQPRFGLEKGKATHCISCKLPDMRNVVDKICIICGLKQSTFGIHQSKPTHCGDCKGATMRNVKQKLCEGCKVKRPSFGMVRGQATHCKDCKDAGMRDVVNKLCVGCASKMPTFGHENSRPTHCKGCKKAGMRDVINKMCVGCGVKQPSFGVQQSKPTHCRDCKEAGMRDVINKMCIQCCVKVASCGLEGGKATHCGTCKSDEMKDVVNKRCAGQCGGTFIERNQQYCANCDTQRKRLTRVRENKVANFLRDRISRAWTTWNKQAPGSRECGGSMRPDFLYVLDFLIIVVECDEDQHKDRCLEGERQRMIDLFNTYGGLPIVFIRFNPDAFKVGGVTCRYGMDRRHALLKEVLERELSRTVEEVASLPTIRVNYLCYDTQDHDSLYKHEVYVPKEAYESVQWQEIPLSSVSIST